MAEPTLSGDLLFQNLPREVINDVEDYGKSPVTFSKFISLISSHVSNDISKGALNLAKNSKKVVTRPDNHNRKRLTYRERRQFGLYTLGKNELQFKNLLPIHKLWVQYMKELLQLDRLKLQRWNNNPNDQNFELISVKLYRADYHGAFFTVIQAKCPSLVGVSGIVAMETKHCFRLVGKDNKCRTIPKQGCQFEFNIDDFKFNFFGKNLTVRPAERSSKKIKIMQIPTL